MRAGLGTLPLDAAQEVTIENNPAKAHDPAGSTGRRTIAAVAWRTSLALIALMAVGGSRAESDGVARLQLEREQAARRLELKLEQLQFENAARPRPRIRPPGAAPKAPLGGTRLPLASIPSDSDALAGSTAIAERRQLRSLFDREQFQQRQLQLEQQRRMLTDRPSISSRGAVANSHHGRLQIQLQRFRMEQRQQMRRFRMRR